MALLRLVEYLPVGEVGQGLDVSCRSPRARRQLPAVDTPSNSEKERMASPKVMEMRLYATSLADIYTLENILLYDHSYTSVGRSDGRSVGLSVYMS